jgi:hypothetical protein
MALATAGASALVSARPRGVLSVDGGMTFRADYADAAQCQKYARFAR